MICNNCGKTNDSESNFCKYCGINLKPAATDPNHTIFDSSYLTQPKSNIDLGYLIISILILINIFLWIAWRFLSGSIIQGNETFFKGIRLISVIFSIAQFVIMFIFAKRQSYKIIIGVIAVIVILYDLYYLIQTLTDRRY